MDDPLPFPLPPDESIAGLCSKCGFFTGREALKEYISESSAISSRLSAVVDRFLSNNHPIPSDTREEISSSLEQDAALLEKVDEAVSQLSELLDGIKAIRDSLADRVRRSRSVLHPLRILPDECLFNIFSHCITYVEGQDDDLLTGIPSQLFANDPWTLTRISRHWRAVSLNTPRIWSNVVIIINEAAEQTFWEPYSLTALNLLLTRSATYPLNVVIHSMYSFSMKHPLIQGVMAHCQRWRRLYLNIPITTFTFLQQIYHNLHILEHLFIEYSIIDQNALRQDTERSATEWDNFNLARNLWSICISPRIIQESFDYSPHFAHQIKKYRTVFCDPDRLPAPPFPFAPSMHLRALRKLPNLVDWTAFCLLDDEWPSVTDCVDFEEEGGLLVMNVLTSIRMKEKEHYWGAIAQVLDRMCAPLLSKLAFEGNLDEGCISSIIDFIDRSDCTHKIQNLTLIDTGHNRGAMTFIPLLSKLSSLRELDLQYTSLPPPPPPPAGTDTMDEEVDLLSTVEVLPGGLEILVLSDRTELNDSILDGVKDARPGLKVRMVDMLEVK
jgi:hypothetical protein